jgi:hypothetical protein
LIAGRASVKNVQEQWNRALGRAMEECKSEVFNLMELINFFEPEAQAVDLEKKQVCVCVKRS